MAKQLVSFQLIADGRWYKDPAAKISDMDKQLKQAINDNPAVELAQDTGFRVLNWGDYVQYRADYWIRKTGKITNAEIYELVNDIYPTPFRLVRDNL